MMINQTYSDGENIYSVYLMFLYTDKFPIRSVKVPVRKLLPQLKDQCWGDPERDLYSPWVVVKGGPDQYPREIERIKKADLRYPIMIDTRIDNRHNFNVVDGMHRLTKAHLLKKKTIRAYLFSPELIEKFKLFSHYQQVKNVWSQINQMTQQDFLTLFQNRFLKSF